MNQLFITMQLKLLKQIFNQLVFLKIQKKIVTYLCKCFFPQILNMSPKQSPMNGLTPRPSTLSRNESSQWTVQPRGTITRTTSSSQPGPSSQPRKPPSQSRPSVRRNRFLLCQVYLILWREASMSKSDIIQETETLIL